KKGVRVVFVLLLPAVAYQLPRPQDCSDIYRSGSGLDGVYTIYPAGPTSPVQVYCDMGRDDVGDSAEKWTVIQRRQDGTVNFFMKWDHYKSGFGNAAGEYWLGLETMHLLTQTRNYELRVDMEDFEGQKVFALYSAFSVGSEADGYKLNLGSFIRGAAGDSLSFHNGRKFTTIDKDQDSHVTNCARNAYGAFWYGDCHTSNPNGIYAWGPSARATGVHWNTFKGLEYSLKTMIMKIRPVAL
uniref:Microfibril associated protein 4 n=1 Tax=Cyprinodon variegatus TaxID=28743 RepID=A0A3Q2DUB7_CYPVA